MNRRRPPEPMLFTRAESHGEPARNPESDAVYMAVMYLRTVGHRVFRHGPRFRRRAPRRMNHRNRPQQKEQDMSRKMPGVADRRDRGGKFGVTAA